MIQKQPLPINFAKGLDQKTDPWQVSPDRFLELNNCVFTEQGKLTKRKGYDLISSSLAVTVSAIKTFQDSLTAIGNRIYSFNESSESFIDKGAFRPLTINTTSLVKNNFSQTQCDSATSSNGLICVAYTENQSGTTAYRYSVVDGTTGQVLIPPTVILSSSGGVASGSPRVFILENNFIVAFTAVVSATNRLQYFSIGINSLQIGATVNISSAYTPASTVAFDAYEMNGSLYFAWNSSGGGGILMATLNSSLTLSAAVNIDASHVATIVSVCSDGTYVYVAYYDNAAKTGHITIVNQNVTVIAGPTQWTSVVTILSLTANAYAGTATLFYETSNTYSFDSSVSTNFISKNTYTSSGTLGTATVLKRSVGLASKAFRAGTLQYVLTAYSSPGSSYQRNGNYQPSYFLIDENGAVVAQLAYQNGGGYLATGLPAATVTESSGGYGVVNYSTVSIAYLFKNFISSVATGTTNVSQTPNIYSQTGINAVEFTIGGSDVYSAEIGKSLNLTGGFLWGYDGSAAVENGFFLYPDSIEATWSASGGSIVAQPDGATNTNAYFFQVCYEWSDNQGNQYKSTPSIPISVTTTGNGSSGSITVNVPTLRVTNKTNVKITIFRWSVGQQSYYQTTSITSPTVNNSDVDSISFVDTNSDATILGNSLIYTTGGVVENTSTPAPDAVTIFDDRLWMIDGENKDVLWYSKQVIPAAPVEMSGLLTLYVSPTQSTQGSTGPMKCIAPMDDKLIILKKSAIYYINGTGPDNTGANSQYSQPVFVTATVGSENQDSLALIPDGLMFESDKGIWILKRDLSTEYIGAPVERYTSDGTVTSAQSIPGTNQVRFTLTSGITLMYDYFYGQWGTFSSVEAISGTIYQGKHAVLTLRGVNGVSPVGLPTIQRSVLQESEDSYLDGSRPVTISFKTAWINLAGLQGYQRAYFFYLLGKYITPHKLQVYVAYDYSEGPTQSTLIEPTNFSGVYGGPSVNPSDGTDYASPYGQDSTFGGSSHVDDLARGYVEQWRVFLAKQKCQSVQISVQEIYDPSFDIAPGEGLTLSGLNFIYGIKKGFRPIAASNSIGGGGNNL